MKIREPVSEADWGSVKELIREYFDWVHREQGIDLNFQGIEQELASLPGAFSPPAGCLLLAESGDQVAGCVALRPLEAGICEMKRMYVRPQFRGKGIGKALGEQIIREARIRHYHTMRLDTADTMTDAQSLYRALGFQQTEAYYDLPPEVLKRAVFLELCLRSQHEEYKYE